MHHRSVEHQKESLIDGLSNIDLSDEHANVMTEDYQERPDDWTPELHDIPISVVNAFLYQQQPTGYEKEDLDSLDEHLTMRRKTKRD